MRQLDPKAVWLFFIALIFRWFLVLIFVGFWLSFFRRDSLDWLWIIILALLIFFWVWAKLSYRFYRYELREDGFRKEHGVIWKKYVTIPYDRIQNVDIYRGVIARLLSLSDLQIQTAGGITAGSYGAFSEGRLPGLSREVAEQMRDELIRQARQSKNQGL